MQGSSQQVIVPASRTPLSTSEAVIALHDAYRDEVGRAPSPEILGLLAAQSHLETAGWHSIWGYNFGNSKASESYKGLVQLIPCSEIENGKEVHYPDCRFRAFTSAEDGARDHIRVLQSRPAWWQGLQSGTVDGYIDGLTTPPMYFTGSKEQYRAGLKARLSSLASDPSYPTFQPGA